MSENCKSLVLQDKCNIEIFLSTGYVLILSFSNIKAMRLQLDDLCCSFDWDRVCMTVNFALAWQYSDIKIVNIFLAIRFNLCYGCLKQPSH